MNIGIIGQGFVGSAIREGLKNYHSIKAYDLDSNYIEKEENVINNMTLEQHQELANKYLDESKMAYLVVGDAKTQFEQFKDMGFDEVKLLNKEGEEINMEDVK